MNVATVPGLKQILLDWPNAHISRRIMKTDAIPLAARWMRFCWGVVPMGEPEPWEIPQGIDPKDCPYNYLLWQCRIAKRATRTAT